MADGMLLNNAPKYVAPATYVTGVRLPSGTTAAPGITAAMVQGMLKKPTPIAKIKIPSVILKMRPSSASQEDTFDVTPGVLAVGLLLVAGAGYLLFYRGTK